jgi:serine/threonine protein kinase
MHRTLARAAVLFAPSRFRATRAAVAASLVSVAGAGAVSAPPAACAPFRRATEEERAEAAARRARRRALRSPSLRSKYEVLRRLGAGRYAVVYEARRRGTEHRVAVKLIDRAESTPMDIAREMLLLKLLGRSGHSPRLIEVVDCGPTHLALVLERAEGGELFELISSSGPLDERHARRFVRQLAQALHTMHAQGLTHNDLKPENVLLTRRSAAAPTRALLADFGQSRISEKVGSRARPGRFFGGTWSYSAPESMRDGAVSMSAADMWSLGVMTYVMLCGVHPFDPTAEDPDGVVVGRILRGAFDREGSCWRKRLGEEAKRVLEGLLEVDAEKR